MLTIEEIGVLLAGRFEHEELCDLLDISTEELVEAFLHKVEERYESINYELED